MSPSKDKETGVFIGAYVPVDTASKLILASVSSSKSDIVRAALREHLDQLSPSPTSRMVNHLLAEWHKTQAAPTKRKITFESYCKKAKAQMIEMKVSPTLANDVYERLKLSSPAVEAQ